MAIKVTGTTVINDSRKIEINDGIPQVIRKPTITSPADGATDTATDLTITGSAYAAVYSGTRDYREFQIDLDSGDFSSPVRTNQVDADSWAVSPDLDNEESYKVRIRDVDVDGNVSEFSDEVSFTTAVPGGTDFAGQPFCGGFYMGRICAAGTCYNLIVAPNATGCADCQWKTSNTSTSGTCSDVDGYANTYPALENSDHPAGNWTATRTIDGFSDWYLPAIDELEVFYNNGAAAGSGDPLPSGEDFTTGNYWSSTEGSSDRACSLDFDNGIRYNSFKGFALNVRAVRRVPV